VFDICNKVKMFQF